MKNILQIPWSMNTSKRSKVEPAILWNLKDYPLSYMPIIIQLQKDIDRSFEKKLKKAGCKDITYFKIINGFYTLTPVSKLKDFINFPAITYISLNHKVFSHMNHISERLTPSVVSQFSSTGRNITIAHLDTGIYPHNDLTKPRNRIKFFKDFLEDAPRAFDDNGHGSYCAGCIAGNGNLSKGEYKGIAPDTLLIGLKCLDEKGTGDIKLSLQALEWIYDNYKKYNIKIVHLPFGTFYPYYIKKDPLIKAVEKLWDMDMVVVCSAGNNGPIKASISSPANSEKVITVGSSTKAVGSDTPQSVCQFSSRGPTLTGLSKPDLVAPGKDIVSLNPSFDRPYITFSGSSVSSSIVAGAVALLLEKNPDFTPDEVKLALEMSCDSLYLNKNSQGKGVLNIEKLLAGQY